MKIGVVILARLSSSRLPEKALIQIKDKEVILHIIDAVAQVIPIDNLIVGTSTASSDDPLVKFLESRGINVYRGSLTNVSRRFFEASVHLNLDYSVRINGDNIFLDIQLLKEVTELLGKGKYKFISNVKERTYPKGMSIEAVDLQYYNSLLSSIETSDYHKEHVMSLLYELDSNDYHYIYNEKYPEAGGIQLALDTYEDLERTKKLMNKMSHDNWFYGLSEVYQLAQNL